MSMRTYAVDAMGVVVKYDELDCSAFEDGDGNRPKDMDELCECLEYEYIVDGGSIVPKQTFGNDLEGDFIPLLDQSASIDVDATLDDWVIFDLPKYPSLFKAPYKDADDMISQLKATYSKYLLPKDFDWGKRMVRLMGTTWG